MGRIKMGCGKVKEPSATLRRAKRTPPASNARKAPARGGFGDTRVPRVVQARAVAAFRLFLSFDDGVAGELDLASRLRGPVFEPLKDERYFAQASVNHELGTVVWPNGADFAPEVLHDELLKLGKSASPRTG